MIPASYMFKDIYKQKWEDADTAPAITENRGHFIDGLMTPIAGAISALFHRRHHRSANGYSSHAYE